MKPHVAIISRLPLREAADKAIEALRRLLDDVPFIEDVEIDSSQVTERQSAWDYRITLRVNGQLRSLIAEYMSSGQPRIARAAADHLARLTARHPDSYPLFIAPFVSPRAAEICAAENIGYMDSAGNCRLSFDGVYVRVDGRNNPYTVKRDLRSLYSPKAERVLRVLLEHPSRAWRVQELADIAEVSLGQVANVKTLLADREWLRTEVAGLKLTNPDALISEWVENYRFGRSGSGEFYSLEPHAEIEAKIADTCASSRTGYALAVFSAAARYAPFVRYQRVHAYVDGDIDSTARQLGLKPVTSGANVILLTPYDNGVFHAAQTIDGIRVSSPIQSYLDVSSQKGRGEEAASMLLGQVIQPGWKSVDDHT